MSNNVKEQQSNHGSATSRKRSKGGGRTARKKARKDSEKKVKKLSPGVYRTTMNLKKHSNSLFEEHYPSCLDDTVTVADGRILFTRKTYDETSQEWREKEEYIAGTYSKRRSIDAYCVKLSRGGAVHIFPNLLNEEKSKSIQTELLNCDLWRNYTIQNGPEPRLHFLLHKNASGNFEEEQPGYRYAKITMKARPLSSLPVLKKLSKRISKRRAIKSWNIGVQPVLYRDNTDSLGDHSDDDQGETCVFCAVVLCDIPRKVRINVFGRDTKANGHREGDEVIEMFLRTGDAYEMDGKMQQFYSHCIPKTTSFPQDMGKGWFNKGYGMPSRNRICVVLRRGKKKKFSRDSGIAATLEPKRPFEYTFGNLQALDIGSQYTRRELIELGAMNTRQGGVSGNSTIGSDAIVVSGKRPSVYDFPQMTYDAIEAFGAGALRTSCKTRRPVRVFRKLPDSVLYRYDGVYVAIGWDVHPDSLDGLHTFQLIHGKHYLSYNEGLYYDESIYHDTCNADVLEKMNKTLC